MTLILNINIETYKQCFTLIYLFIQLFIFAVSFVLKILETANKNVTDSYTYIINKQLYNNASKRENKWI